MKIQFTDYNATHQSELLQMMEDFYAIDGYEFDKDQTKQNLHDFGSNPALGRLFLIRADHDIAGYIVLAFGFSFEYGGRDAFIDELYIKSSFRGSGIGKMAMDYALQEARNNGIKVVHLEVEAHNEKAQGLYRSIGFQENDRKLMHIQLDQMEQA